MQNLCQEIGESDINQQRNSGKRNTQTGRLDPNRVLNKRYMILRTIGQGGMGAVYQARDLKNQTTCAVKEMSLAMVAPDEREQAIQNFRGEATLLSQLRHVNLPSFTGFFTEGSRYFMVMEYVDGSTLEELLDRNTGPFPERRVLNWARQLCDVLQYLHSQRPPIIFRDMKPGNIMLMRNGRIKLIDFGIARFVRHSGSQDTQLLGTPGYAPPEQYGKAQTDERSDIYSLAMTLFQLMTNTLSENGFGLKDVRAINPSISPIVARALEKATALAPEDRFQNVEAFRRALLGVGTFVFEDGGQATTPEELAELCAHFPEEAADYLFAGEIESWLREIGENDLARATQQIRNAVSDPQEGVERFLRMVMGPGARTRTSPALRKPGSSQKGISSPGGLRGRLSRGSSRSSVVINPRTIDFGQVYPGVSPPISLTISGYQGIMVRGTIHTSDPWIQLDQAQFDAMSTRISIRVDSTRLRGPTEGAVIVMSEDMPQEITIPVSVEVMDWDATSSMSTTITRNGARGQPQSGGTSSSNLGTAASTTQGGMTMAQAITGSISSNTARDQEYKAKYGSPGRSLGSWDPLQATSRQRSWMQRVATVFAAFMLASLFYSVVSNLPPFAHNHPLPPSPWFIVVLLGIIPSAALGALLVNRNQNWPWRETINQACTGMSIALLALGLSELIWQGLLHLNIPVLQLVIVLTITAFAAAFGSNPTISQTIMDGAAWAVAHLRWFMLGVAVVIGGSLGYVLTVGFALGCLTPFGILLGIGVGIALFFRVDRMINHP